MLSVISGNTLGLFGASSNMLGGATTQGAVRDSQYVNIRSGNLVLQAEDERLAVRGFLASQLRTYNSQGALADTGADGWMSGWERYLVLTGTAGQAGSTLTRFAADGSATVYAWDASRSAYLSTQGGGAHDTIAASGGDWVWTEGSSRAQEVYDGANGLRLKSALDAISGATYTYTWSAGRVTEISGAGGDALVFGYDANGRLALVSSRESGVLRGQVKYAYDAQGRLSQVSHDLTPADAGDAWDFTGTDGRDFVTTYAYEGTSLRITSISDSDGRRVSYAYDASGRLASLTVGDLNANDGDGFGHTLVFTYDAANRTTHVADGAGRTWSYVYDAQGRLAEIQSPAVDGQRQVTRYRHDAATGDMLASVDARGQETRYTYDINGNVTREETWAQRRMDATLGVEVIDVMVVTRTWNAANQLLTESRHAGARVVRASDGQLVTAESGRETARYVYDANQRLRFAIGASGEVQERVYGSSGGATGQLVTSRTYLAERYAIAGLGATDAPTLATMEAWAATRLAQAGRTDYAYDAAGRLARSTTFATLDAAGAGVLDAGATVTAYLHDAQGRLLREDSLRGAARDQVVESARYTYDGLGRVLSRIGGDGAITTWTHLDSQGTLRTDFANGLVRTEVRDAAGKLLAVTESAAGQGTRTSENIYDATGRLRASRDAMGGLSYFFYDATGRLTAQVGDTVARLEDPDANGVFTLVASVNPLGEATSYSYDADGRVIATRQHAQRINTAGWLVNAGTAAAPRWVVSAETPATAGIVNAATDRITTRTYDAAGRLATSTDAAGTVTRHAYDGAGRLVGVQVGEGAEARVSRQFYDASGRLEATLDAAGYLVRQVYDAAGRLVEVIRYAKPTPAAARATGTLAALIPATDAADQRERLFHDASGALIGRLDAEGYVTRYLVDQRGVTRAVGTGLGLRQEERRYERQLTGLAANATFAQILAQLETAPASAYRSEVRLYNAAGQLELSRNAEGSDTLYRYDAMGRMVASISAWGVQAEARATLLRYSAFGEVLAEMSGEGVDGLVDGALAGTLPAGTLDAAFAELGLRHAYDANGRRVQALDQDGHATWYYHDALGRQRFVVAGVVGSGGAVNAEAEVTEVVYSSFGQVAEVVTYEQRIATTGLNRLIGSILSATSGVANHRDTSAYDARGLLVARTDALGRTTSFAYNAFGELASETRPASAGQTLRTTFQYDARGQRIGMIADDVAGGARLTATTTYDAFGRAISSTDARGTTTTISYDRLGRQVGVSRTVGGRVEAGASTWDAFGRVLTSTDALGRSTTYAYSDTLRSVVMTSPEGLSVTSLRNRHGDTIEVRDAAGAVQTFAYNRDGQRVSSTDANGATSLASYDDRGLLIETTDATGVRVAYTYDARGRQLTRTENPGGLALQTRWTYDAEGRAIEVRDPSGRVTRMVYDDLGQLVETIADPTGLALRTVTAWDEAGRELSVTIGAGTAAATTVTYAYDRLGRRTGETTAAGTTSYAYDANGNVVTRTDALGRLTRYAYDEANRLVASVDAAGGVTRSWYDANGREVASVAYATAISLDGLGAAPTLAQIAARVSADASRDAMVYRVLDGDGRVRASFVASGWVPAVGDTPAHALYSVSRVEYDASGRVSAEHRHANRIALSATQRDALLAGASDESVALGWISAGAGAAVSRYLRYDASGQLRFSVDEVGAVTEQVYDAAGRVRATHGYRDLLSSTALAGLQAGTTTTSALAALVAPGASTRVSSAMVYDTAGRLRYTVAAGGEVSEQVLDAAGRVTTRHSYGTALADTPRAAAFAGTLDAATLAAALAPQAGSRRTSYTVHDAAGRAVLAIDALGGVTRSRLDAAGRVVTNEVYAQALTLTASQRTALEAGTQTVAAMDALLAPQHATRRSSDRVYDAAGRQVFAVDQLGHVVETVYDAIGQVTASKVYTAPISRGNRDVSLTAAGVRTQLAGLTANTTSYGLDAVGRATTVTNALGQVEHFTFDALGRKTSHRNVANDTVTWTYDAAGRVLGERSPPVPVTTVDANGTATTVLRAVEVRFEYDAFGNASKRIEDATHQQRTTEYTYDARQRLVRTTFPAAGRVLTDGSIALVGDEANRPWMQTTYDAFGNAVVERDVRGNHLYRVFDALQRPVLEVDAEGYVTETRYTGFGEQEILRRYDVRMDRSGLVAGAPLTASTVTTRLGAGPTFREITNRYDALGRRIETQLPQVDYERADGESALGRPTTRFHYDALGQLVRESVLLQGTPDTADAIWAETRHSFDVLGRRTHTVDANRHLSEWRYDALGRVSETIEYARALTTTAATGSPPAAPAAGDDVIGRDRRTTYGYDALGRVTREESFRWVFAPANPAATQVAAGATASTATSVVTDTAYDDAGRKRTVTVGGVATQLQFDALGRQLGVRESARSVLVADAEARILAGTADLSSAALYRQVQAHTSMAYDAFGNLVEVRRHALGAQDGQAAVASADDQVMQTRYDLQGRAVWERGPTGAIARMYYNAADQLIERVERATLPANEALPGYDGRSAEIRRKTSYDALGRTTAAWVERTSLLNGTVVGEATDAAEYVQYNAHGEVTGKGHAAGVFEAQYVYDGAGRLIGSNADTGAMRAYAYNLAGHQQSLRFTVRGLDALGNAAPVQAVTRFTTDAMGRNTQVHEAAYNTAGDRAIVRVFHDRWGNTIEVQDARGGSTHYAYDATNQVIRESRPDVVVVSATGASTSERPELHTYRDAFGRVVGTRDANGNHRTVTLDELGRVLSTRNAVGDVTRYGYDVLGNQQLTQDGTGYLTFRAFDTAGQVVAHGDYLREVNATTRAKAVLESYVLDAMGQRRQVTDAMGLVSRYDYDSRGLVVRSQTPAGVVMTYAYDAGGRKVREANALRQVAIGTDRDGDAIVHHEQSWDYDFFGRVVDYNDLSGRDYDYTYDAGSGALATENNTWDDAKSRETFYYANGRIREVRFNGSIYRYEYDAAGNRTYEYTETVDSRANVVKRETFIAYDAHNRMSQVVQRDVVSGEVFFNLVYGYDAQGNRRFVRAQTGFLGPSANRRPTVTGQIAPLDGPTPGVITLARGQAAAQDFGTAVFTDPNGDTLTFTAIGLPPGMSVDSATRRFVGTPSAEGDFQVTLKASDGKGGEVYAPTFTLRIVNVGPVANGISQQEWTPGVHRSFEIPATAFNDANGDALTITVTGLPPGLQFDPASRTISGTLASHGRWPITVTASDGRAQASNTFDIVVQDQAPVATGPVQLPPWSRNVFGSWTVPPGLFADPNGAPITYSMRNLPPGLTFNATTRTLSGTLTTQPSSPLVLVAFDGTVETTRSLPLQVVNDVPRVVDSLPAVAAVAGEAVSLLTAGAFSDPNGDGLTYVAQVWMPGGFDWSNPAEPVELPWQWVALSVIGLSINGSTGAITGAPQRGTYTIRVMASDAQSTSAAASFVLTSSARPQLSTTAVSMVARQPGSRQLVATDADGGTLVFAAVSGLPAGMQLSASGLLSGTVPEVGSYPIVVRVTDPTGLSSTRTLTLTATNSVPVVANTLPALSVPAGQAFSHIIPVGTFSDPNGHGLTWSASNLPAGVSFDPATRTLSGTPAQGTSTITVSVSDGFGGSASTTLSFSAAPPANVAPVVANPIADQWSMWHRTWTFTVPANVFIDPNGDPLTLSASGMPSGMTFNAATRTFSFYTPRSTQGFRYTITVSASDGRGGSVSDSFALDVEPWETAGGGGGGGPGNPQDPVVIQRQSMLQASSTSLSPEASAAAAGEGDAPPVTQPGIPVDGGGYVGQPVTTLPDASGLEGRVVESWYTYDAENRVAVSGGRLVNGQVLLDGSEGAKSYLYDAAGRESVVVTAPLAGVDPADAPNTTMANIYDERGRLVARTVGGDIVERVAYDALGRVTDRRTYSRSSVTNPPPGWSPPPMMLDLLASMEEFTYSAQTGLLELHLTRTRPRPTSGNTPGSNDPPMAINDPDTILAQMDESLVDYRASAGAGMGYDAAGRLLGYKVTQEGVVLQYRTTYEGRTGYNEIEVLGTSSNSGFRASSSYLDYDAMGRNTEVREVVHYGNGAIPEGVRSMAFDGEGRVISLRTGELKDNAFTQGDTDEKRDKATQAIVHANGQQLATLRRDGTMDAIGRHAGFSGPSGSIEVLVQAGDTLRSVAQRVYGDADMWYLIAEANALGSADATLTAGTTLTAPGARTASNDANTFKPYNPSEIVGSTAPNVPFIPSDSCAKILMVVMIVVAIVVTVYTAGAAAQSLGLTTAPAGTAGAATATGAATSASTAAATFSTGSAALAGGSTLTISTATGTMASALTAAGFSSSMVIGVTSATAAGIGAAAGSVASQLVGLMTGAIDRFSWSGVATSAFTGMLSAGFGNLAAAGKFSSLFASPAAAGAIAGAGSATVSASVNGGFSWREVAGNAVGSFIGSTVTGPVGAFLGKHVPTQVGQFASTLLTSMASSVISQTVRTGMFGKREVDMTSAFADGLGASLVGQLDGSHMDRADAIRQARNQRVRADEIRIDYESMIEGGMSEEWALSIALQPRGSLPNYLMQPSGSDLEAFPSGDRFEADALRAPNAEQVGFRKDGLRKLASQSVARSRGGRAPESIPLASTDSGQFNIRVPALVAAINDPAFWNDPDAARAVHAQVRELVAGYVEGLSPEDTALTASLIYQEVYRQDSTAIWFGAAPYAVAKVGQTYSDLDVFRSALEPLRYMATPQGVFENPYVRRGLEAAAALREGFWEGNRAIFESMLSAELVYQAGGALAVGRIQDVEAAAFGQGQDEFAESLRGNLLRSFVERDLAKVAKSEGDDNGYARHIAYSLAASARFEQGSVLQQYYDVPQSNGMSLRAAIGVMNRANDIVPGEAGLELLGWPSLDAFVTKVVVGDDSHYFNGSDIGNYDQRMPFVDNIAGSVVRVHLRESSQLLREAQALTSQVWDGVSIDALRRRHGIRLWER